MSKPFAVKNTQPWLTLTLSTLLKLLTCLDRRPFCLSRYVSNSSIFFLYFTVSLSLRCDMVALACSLEHEILSLQTAGVWYSTWCLTASHTVSAFDDSAFVPATGFWYFTMHTECDCRPPPPRKLSNVEFCKVRLANSHHHQDCVYVCGGSIHIWRRRRIPVYSFSPHPQRPFVFKLWGRRPPKLALQFQLPPETALLVSQWVRGFTQQSVMPQLPITCLSPTQPSSHDALFYQHHSLKHISATPNLSVEGLLGAHFSLPLSLLFLSSPSASFPKSFPSFPSYTACLSSFCFNERQGSAR